MWVGCRGAFGSGRRGNSEELGVCDLAREVLSRCYLILNGGLRLVRLFGPLLYGLISWFVGWENLVCGSLGEVGRNN